MPLASVPSLARTLLTWWAAVLRLMKRCAAISDEAENWFLPDPDES